MTSSKITIQAGEAHDKATQGLDDIKRVDYPKRDADKKFLTGVINHHNRGSKFSTTQLGRLWHTLNRIENAKQSQPKTGFAAEISERLRDRVGSESEHWRGLEDQQDWFLKDIIAFRKRLTPSDIIVLGYLYKRTHQRRDYIERYVLIRDIMRFTELSKSTVCKSLNKLETLGLFRREQTAGGKTIFYELLSRAERRHCPERSENGDREAQNGVRTARTAQPPSVSEQRGQHNPENCPSVSEQRGQHQEPFKNHEEPFGRSPREAARRPTDNKIGLKVEKRASARFGPDVSGDSEGSGDADQNQIERAAVVPPRRHGRPKEWESFRDRFYTDGNWDIEGEALADREYRHYDRTYCYEVLGEEFDLDFDVVMQSLDRFFRRVKDQPFPGTDAAKADVNNWLRREKQKLSVYARRKL